MKVLDLFAGIGGFSLAAHWMDWNTIGFVEWDEYNQKVLAKNFPDVPIHGDIREYKGKKNAADIICGGFPCQPFSSAGKREGKADDRHLWPEMLRVIREVQPAWVVGENVAGLVSMDSGAVLEEICTDLESEGYEVQAFVIPAISKGAPHRRDRIWIVGHAKQARLQRQNRVERTEKFAERNSINTAYAKGERCGETRESCQRSKKWSGWPNTTHTTNSHSNVYEGGLDDRRNPKAATGGQGGDQCKRETPDWQRVWSEFSASNKDFTNTNSEQPERSIKPHPRKGAEPTNEQPFRCYSLWQIHWHEAATRLCRMDDGLPAWVDRRRTKRLKSLGNAIVPQVAYGIFKAIDLSQST